MKLTEANDKVFLLTQGFASGCWQQLGFACLSLYSRLILFFFFSFEWKVQCIELKSNTINLSRPEDPGDRRAQSWRSMAWHMQFGKLVISAGFFLRFLLAFSSPLQAACKHFSRDYVAVNLLQMKSELSKLNSVSSTVLDLGQLIPVMIKSRGVACRMGILKQRNERYCKYWRKSLPGLCSQNSTGLGSILNKVLTIPKPLLNQHILKLQEDLNVHVIFVAN